ncbi:MAG: 50S ribosomal protein L11 methyltransferase [Thiohalomonadaceae bacterium]
MPWLQLILETDDEQAPGLAAWLDNAGAMAVTMEDDADQPLYEPPLGATPLWHSTRVIALFETSHDIDTTLNELQAFWLDELPPWRLEQLEDRDWTREWMDSYQPMRFGQQLWIVPSWTTAPDPGSVNILLDPGLAFGTGTHQTTRLCLEWLDAHPVQGQQVIDYGCGSGILAIAAALLGAEHVWAIDNDPQALIATHDNAQRNAVTARIQTALPKKLPSCQSDLLIANILAGPLIELAPHFAQLVRPAGTIVLSGILPDQAEQVRRAYQDWFHMTAPCEFDGWVRLEGQRR